MKKDPIISRNLDFGIEPLESRQMLAGNVVASITGAGNLVINGDDADNKIIVGISGDGDVSIVTNDTTNIDTSGLQGSRVTGDVRINMKGGDDYVLVYGGVSSVPIDDVRVIAGSGDDRVAFESLRGMTGNLSISGGSGNDDVSAIYNAVGKNFTISGGSGDDSIVSSINEVQRNFRLNGGGGDDLLSVSESDVSGKLTMNAGGGNDYLVVKLLNERIRLNVQAGGGNDGVLLEDVFADGRVNGGGGRDVLGIDSIPLGPNFVGFESVLYA